MAGSETLPRRKERHCQSARETPGPKPGRARLAAGGPGGAWLGPARRADAWPHSRREGDSRIVDESGGRGRGGEGGRGGGGGPPLFSTRFAEGSRGGGGPPARRGGAAGAGSLKHAMAADAAVTVRERGGERAAPRPRTLQPPTPDRALAERSSVTRSYCHCHCCCYCYGAGGGPSLRARGQKRLGVTSGSNRRAPGIRVAGPRRAGRAPFGARRSRRPMRRWGGLGDSDFCLFPGLEDSDFRVPGASVGPRRDVSA